MLYEVITAADRRKHDILLAQLHALRAAGGSRGINDRGGVAFLDPNDRRRAGFREGSRADGKIVQGNHAANAESGGVFHLLGKPGCNEKERGTRVRKAGLGLFGAKVRQERNGYGADGTEGEIRDAPIRAGYAET